MAAALNPDEVIRSSKGRENLARLLINRCTVLLLEIEIACAQGKQFGNPALMRLLEVAEFRKPQWSNLRRLLWMFGKSKDFDTTRLFQLLRRKYALIPPASKDDSLEADLAIIICNCNLLYNCDFSYRYTKEDMEPSDDRFLVLWRDFSKALVRVAGQISPAKAKEWKDAFDTLLKDPLTEEDKRHEQELQRWYQKGTKVKEYLEEIEPLMERLEEEAQYLIQKIRGGTQDIKDQLGGKVESTAQEVQHLGQDIKDQLRLKVSGPIPQLEVSLLIFFFVYPLLVRYFSFNIGTHETYQGCLHGAHCARKCRIL